MSDDGPVATCVLDGTGAWRAICTAAEESDPAGEGVTEGTGICWEDVIVIIGGAIEEEDDEDDVMSGMSDEEEEVIGLTASEETLLEDEEEEGEAVEEEGGESEEEEEEEGGGKMVKAEKGDRDWSSEQIWVMTSR